MNKLLLLIGLVVLFFAQSSYAKSYKGNKTNITWHIYGGSDPYAQIPFGNSIDTKIKLRLNWGYTTSISKIDSFKCLDFTSKDYFNVRCEEIGIVMDSKYRAKQENITRIKRFTNLIAQDVCENPIITHSQFESAFLLMTGFNHAKIKCPKTLAKKKRIEEEKRLAQQKEEQEALKLEQEAQALEQVDAQQKKIETCEAYGFEKGSEPFGQCIFKLMELDLEYAKLENEQLRLEAQAEQAKLSNQTALAQSLASQAQASNRDKALRIQQFGLAMQGIANSFQTPSSMANPKITCHNFGTQMKCW